jgi:hypothetical protein
VELRELGIGDTVQRVFKPLVRINLMFLTAGHEAVDHSGPLGGFVRASKKIVLSAQGQGPDFVFDMVIIDE